MRLLLLPPPPPPLLLLLHADPARWIDGALLAQPGPGPARLWPPAVHIFASPPCHHLCS